MDEHVTPDEALVEEVARAVARAGGFHDADWSTALTEQERQRYRWDARAAIEAVRKYDAEQGMDRRTEDQR
jgi:hypothetical protein